MNVTVIMTCCCCAEVLLCWNRHVEAAVVSTALHFVQAHAQALRSYTEAYSLAKSELSPTHPLRLEIARDLASYLQHTLQQPDGAAKVAKEAFDDSIAELDTLDEDSYMESTLHMQVWW